MRLSEAIGEMLRGPLHFRFIIQPLVAILLGIRDGRLDMKAGRSPFLLSLLTERASRWQRFRSALRSLAIPLVVAVVLDSVVQVLLWSHLRIGSAILVGGLLVALPYSLARGWSNRLSRALRARHV